VPRHQPQSTNQQPRLCRRRDFRTLLMLPTSANPQHAPFVSSACMQDSNTPTTTRAGGDVRREPVMDRTTTTRVSPCHPFFSFLSLLLSRVWSCAAKTSALGGLLLTLLSLFRHRIICLCTAITATPKLRSPGLHLEPLCDMSWKTRFHFYPIHSPSSSSPPRPLQTYLDFNAILSFIRRVRAF
jgi:hypothetical protein